MRFDWLRLKCNKMITHKIFTNDLNEKCSTCNEMIKDVPGEWIFIRLKIIHNRKIVISFPILVPLNKMRDTKYAINVILLFILFV